MSTFKFDSVIGEYHVYKCTWPNPEVGELLTTKREFCNSKGRFAVAVKKNKVTVGHVPKEISHTMWHFIRLGGEVVLEVTGKRQSSKVRGKGLEIPCHMKLIGEKTLIKRVSAKLKSIL